MWHRHSGGHNSLYCFAHPTVNMEVAKHYRSVFHTASFWNIIIQWTSHDDLTEK